MKNLLLSAAIALAHVPLFAAAAPAPAPAGKNILMTVTIVDSEPDGGTARRSASMLALDGRRSRLVTGWRLPIATTTFDATAAGSEQQLPRTAYQYQRVGLSASLESRITGDRRVRVDGRIEVSAIDSEDRASAVGPSAPRIATFSHQFDVLLADGVAATLAEVPNPEGSSMVLTLTAAIQD